MLVKVTGDHDGTEREGHRAEFRQPGQAPFQHAQPRERFSGAQEQQFGVHLLGGFVALIDLGRAGFDDDFVQNDVVRGKESTGKSRHRVNRDHKALFLR